MVSRLILNLRDDQLCVAPSSKTIEFSTVGPHFSTRMQTYDEELAMTSQRDTSFSVPLSFDETEYTRQDRSRISLQHHSIASESATTLANPAEFA